MIGSNSAKLLALTLLMAGALRAVSAADAPAEQPEVPAVSTVDIQTDVIQSARIVKGPSRSIYPDGQILDNREGWVVLSMMIGTDGKPYEATVVDSSGNPAFEKAALNALDQISFEPAKRGGIAVESNLKFKLKFAIKDLAKGATPQFVSAYKQVSKAVAANDKLAAEAQLARLQPRNLYEEAFANIARYIFDATWGNLADQYRDLGRAIAGETKPGYLPKETFVNALFAKFRIEVQSQLYGNALDTWDVLEPLASAEIRKAGQVTAEQINALVASKVPIRLAGEIGERGWRTQLLRNRFSVKVESGSISNLKLRCAGKFLAFKYQPDFEYLIGNATDQCALEVIGEPGTTFTFVQ